MTDRVVDLDVRIMHQTDHAILVKNLKEESVWLPSSLIEIHSDSEITAPEWLALNKGMI